MSSDYGEKLKDPRWKAKRDVILDRDEHRCTRCNAADVRLHVHHTYYKMGMEPWEYEETSLITVCVPCHEQEDALRVGLRKLIGCVPPTVRDRIYGYVIGQYCRAFHKLGDADKSVPFIRDNPDVSRGVADAFGLEITADNFAVVVAALDYAPMKVADILGMRQFLADGIAAHADGQEAEGATDAAQEKSP